VVFWVLGEGGEREGQKNSNQLGEFVKEMKSLPDPCLLDRTFAFTNMKIIREERAPCVGIRADHGIGMKGYIDLKAASTSKRKSEI